MKKKPNREIELTRLLEEGFKKHFGNSDGARTFLSPASFVLLGDHTQYNDGTMISTTVDSYIGFRIRKAESNYSIVIDDRKYSAAELKKIDINSQNYLISSLANLISNLSNDDKIEPAPFECYINTHSSKVFGLGNSAATNVGFLFALNSTLKLELSNQQLVEFAVESDRELYGNIVSKPLYYSVLSQRKNSVMYFDTRSDYRKFYTIDDKYKIVVCNSNILKESFSERCRERIQECEVGVKGLRLYIWGIKNLRDVEEKFLQRHVHMLPKRLFMRCLYNVHERKIVEEAHKALRSEQIEEFGTKIYETQEILAEEYEISSEIMDSLVKYAGDSGFCIGSKMISCSYHDSTLNLVEQKNIKKFQDYLMKHYSSSNGNELEIAHYSLSDGVKEIKSVKKEVAP